MMALALQSLWNRRFVAALTILAISLSVALILSVERLRDGARNSFANSVSGIDLIVAPRSNDVQILMATVFGVGSTGTGMRHDVLDMVAAQPGVAWALPMVQGDSHRGFPVIGTDARYFELYKHSGGEALRFADGDAFHGPETAVIGAEVAERFGYEVGTKIINAHGAGTVALQMHDEAPFAVSGVLARTHTAVDRMVFVSIEGFAAIHAEAEPTFKDPLATVSSDEAQASSQINAIYVGLSQRRAILSLQRAIATYQDAPLSAVMPNVALLQLWSITGTAENALRLMSVAVVVASMIGMVVMLSATLESRRREFAILRAVGAAPRHVVGLIVAEAVAVTATGILLALVLYLVVTLAVAPLLAAQFGLSLGGAALSGREVTLLLTVLCFGVAASLLPAWRVYRMTLADGLTTRL